jgi:biopolymer transport protein ExbD
MPKRRDVKTPEKIDINMTPMIDVVFQLMAFFLMTFKVAAVEGDFNMKLPKDERSAGPANTQVEMIDVVMRATPNGDLGLLGVAGAPPFTGDVYRRFQQLTEYVARKVNQAKGAGQDEPEIQIDADDNLRYENIISAVAAVSSYYDASGQAAPLAKKVKFKPKDDAPPPK